MYVNELHQGGIRALLEWDNTIFDNMLLPDGVELADVVDHILYKYGDTPLFSPDPSVIKFYVGRWSKRRLSLWERYKEAIEIEYNPLENYDRKEEFDTTFTPATTDETQISADNASDYQPDAKLIRGGNDNTKVIGRTHGNIGVTTSQQMLISQLDLIPRLDLIDYITDDFHTEFCLQMYV